jgi:hypothetical protein
MSGGLLIVRVGTFTRWRQNPQGDMAARGAPKQSGIAYIPVEPGLQRAE